MKSADASFMAWIDHLPDVGVRIRDGRTKLLELAEQAARLEHDAAVLREQLSAGQVELLMKAMQQWTLADIQNAAQAADRVDPMMLSLDHVEDESLRKRLRRLDGRHLAFEALRVFDAAVVRQHNLMSTASDAERLHALRRVLDWWKHAAQPVCERLTVNLERE